MTSHDANPQRPSQQRPSHAQESSPEAAWSQRVDEVLDSAQLHGELSQLEADASPEQARELRAQQALFRILAESRVDVPESFTESVVGAVRPRAVARWAPVAAAIGLAAAAWVLLAQLGPSANGVVGTLGDFAATTLAAAFGLLAASWSGVGSAVRQVLEPSPVGVAALAVALVGAGALGVAKWRGGRSRRARQRSR